MKNPWFAVLLSYFLPGLGHLYAGRPLRGIVFLIPFLGAFAGSMLYLFRASRDPSMALWLMGAVTVVYAAALVDSHVVTRRAAKADPRKGGKDPWLAAFLSYVLPGVALPGLGQLYGGRPVMGVVFFGLALVLSGVGAGLGPLLMPLHHLVRVVSLWHAQWSIGRSAFPRTFLLLVPLIAAEAVLVDFGIPWFARDVVRAHLVPGSGMGPEIRSGDLVLIDARTYRSREPERGEVVLYRNGEGGAIALARVVALPGEEVQVADGRLQVKGSPVGNLSSPLPDGEWGSLNLPINRYLLIADNARLEPESGLPAPVEGKWILGRAYKRILPFARWSPIGPTPAGD